MKACGGGINTNMIYNVFKSLTGDEFKLGVPSEARIYSNVAIRANDPSALECHIDTEESNTMGLGSSAKIIIVEC